VTAAIHRLRARREALRTRARLERDELREQLDRIAGTIDQADRGIGMVRRVATPPVLVAAGIAFVLLLGRGGARRSLAAGLAALGLVLRIRSAGRLLAGLGGTQAVRRSR